MLYKNSLNILILSGSSGIQRNKTSGASNRPPSSQSPTVHPLPEISALLGVILCIPVSLKQVQACAGQVYIYALEQNRTSEEHTFYSDQEGQYKETLSPEKWFQGQLYSECNRHLHFSTQVVNIELQCLATKDLQIRIKFSLSSQIYSKPRNNLAKAHKIITILQTKIWGREVH